jgi:hypothetical protein
MVKKMILLISISLISLQLTAPVFTAFYILASEPLFNKESLSWASIDYYLDFYDVKEPEIVKTQIRLETGALTSRYCLECRNLFGMKKPRKRETTAIGRDKSMSVYRTWQESIEDYSIWQNQFYKGEDYYEFLLRIHYATDKRYIEKLKLLTNN